MSKSDLITCNDSAFTLVDFSLALTKSRSSHFHFLFDRLVIWNRRDDYSSHRLADADWHIIGNYRNILEAKSETANFICRQEHLLCGRLLCTDSGQTGAVAWVQLICLSLSSMLPSTPSGLLMRSRAMLRASTHVSNSPLPHSTPFLIYHLSFRYWSYKAIQHCRQGFFRVSWDVRDLKGYVEVL